MLARMKGLQAHLRNKLLAGALSAVPIAVVIWAAVLLEENAKPLVEPLGFYFPGLGILLAIVAVYALGLIVTSLIGQIFLGVTDKVLRRVPGLSLLYQAWKDVLVSDPKKAGVFDKVVLVPVPEGQGTQLGFTSGQTVDGRSYCVFLPGVPNPIAGRLVFVEQDACVSVEMSVEDAFKFLLSTGNYVPQGLRQEVK